MKSIGGQIWRVNALLVVNSILAAAIVGIGAYGQRFRHHPLTRFIFLGATTLILPIISVVVSTGTSHNRYVIAQPPGALTWSDHGLVATCDYRYLHSVSIVTWAFLVQLAAINTTVIVAADDREGRNTGPPFELLVQGVWTFYLGISSIEYKFDEIFTDLTFILQFVPFALVTAKMLFKYYAFKKAQRSFAQGRSPRLISGYMQKLQQQEASQHAGEPSQAPHPPPPLLVMGEEGRKVEKQPHGYVFKDNDDSRTLVTMDRIWQLDNSLLPMSSTTEPKDLCLSFALFKLLRCRFARCEVSNVGSVATLNFFWSLLLEDGEHTRVFRVTADELSFVHDYYYTSLPISYSKGWLPVLSAFISFLTIIYCILILVASLYAYTVVTELTIFVRPINCTIWCISSKLVRDSVYPDLFASMNFDIVTVYMLLLLIMMSEAREISSYVCSNWTKVASICHCVRCLSTHPRMHRWVGVLLHYGKCNLMKHWDEKISQCSVLVFHQQRTTLYALLRRLLHLPTKKTKVKLSAAVKVCIIDALRRCNSNGRQLSNGTSSLVVERLLRACSFSSKGTSDTILAWQIATFILEVRYPPRRYESDEGEDCPTPSISDCRIAATHLSRYCVYLLTSYPELLPDDAAWSKSLYKAVKKDATRVLADHRDNLVGSTTPEAEYRKLVEALGEESKHEVLKNGVKLGEQLVEMIEGEETAWKLLAGFWSEMILYIAPSNNLKGHSEAIARGGELITLLWALLFHAGIVVRSGEASGTATVV
ncbi:hypothetical protein EJB05_00421, partial [Eragrostis curvula]